MVSIRNEGSGGCLPHALEVHSSSFMDAERSQTHSGGIVSYVSIPPSSSGLPRSSQTSDSGTSCSLSCWEHWQRSHESYSCLGILSTFTAPHCPFNTALLYGRATSAQSCNELVKRLEDCPVGSEPIRNKRVFYGADRLKAHSQHSLKAIFPPRLRLWRGETLEHFLGRFLIPSPRCKVTDFINNHLSALRQFTVAETAQKQQWE